LPTSIAELQAAIADRYRIERELGQGGMATVYLVHDLRHNRPVAFKVLRPELAATLGPERFLHEIRIAAGLQHPHILPVFDSGDAAGQLWYTMPYVEGETLRQRLLREKQLPLDDARRIAVQVLSALEYAHAHGVIHRDIKPENVLLEGDQAVVADLGIARAISAVGENRLTETGLSLGTPSYMSPEQACAERELDARTDIYSLGCVLYEMLAGEPPFTGPTAQAIIAKRLSEPIPHLGTVRPVPPGVEAVVRKALAKVPADRFRTAADFAAALDTSFVDTRAHAHEITAPARQPWFRRPWLVLLLAGGLAVAVAAVLWWVTGRSVPSIRAANPSPPKSIAVLPFTNLSADPENEYFSDGITEDLVTQLAKIRDLEVVSRTSAMRYKHTDKPLREIGRELGAANLMEGSVRRAGTRVRVSAQLIDATTDRHLWAETYDREMTDVFAIQADIAQRIAAALQAEFSPREKARLEKKPTEDLEAYNLYLLGRFHWNKVTEKDLKQSLDYFKQAIAKDSSFALAYTGLAASYYTLAAGYGHLRPKEASGLARDAILKALALDDELGEAHMALGILRSWFDWDWDGAEREFKRAIELNPSLARAHDGYAIMLSAQGRHDEAIAEIRRAQELDPATPVIAADMGWDLSYARRYDEAIEAFHRTIALEPRFPTSYAGLAWAYAATGRYQEASAALQRGVTRSGGVPTFQPIRGYLYAVSGKKREALAVLDELKARASREYVSPAWFAMVYAGLGDKDRAFAYLDSAYLDRSRELIFLKVAARWDGLRSDPRFQVLLRKVGLER
jgi:serine/threonine protein kinase/Flp pilus assembly protein TadD